MTEHNPLYVAWGIDFDVLPHGTAFWVSVWDETDGPASPEQNFTNQSDANKAARTLALTRGLDAWEVDEFGPKKGCQLV